jgi:hypothetical protein
MQFLLSSAFLSEGVRMLLYFFALGFWMKPRDFESSRAVAWKKESGNCRQGIVAGTFRGWVYKHLNYARRLKA